MAFNVDQMHSVDQHSMLPDSEDCLKVKDILKEDPGCENHLISVLQEDSSVLSFANNIIQQQQCEDPFYIFNLDDVVTQFQTWNQELPRVKPFYAVKCNNNKILLKLLSRLDMGFDCASKAELENVLSAGVSRDRIIYANPCKTKSHIRYAAEQNVKRMTFDNQAELKKISQLFPEAELVIRIRSDAYEAQCPLGAKFGADPSDAQFLLERAKELHLNVIGVSFHVGSGCNDPTAFPRAISTARDVFSLGQKLGFSFTLLDIGGGFPGHEGAWLSFQQLTEGIRQSLDEHFPPEEGIEIIAEPGRFFASAAFTLFTSVIAKRDRKEEEDQINNREIMYYVNDGVYGSFNCVLYDHAVVAPKPLKEYPSQNQMKSSIWGPTCDSLDCVIPEIALPSIQIGEWIVWENMGAYTMSAASTFNGFPVAKSYPIVRHKRTAEQEEQLRRDDWKLPFVEGPLAWNCPKAAGDITPVTAN